MSGAKHTPGPWLIDLDVIVDTDDIETQVEIATVGPSARPILERKANLRLIAAAPELLARVRDRFASCTCLAGVKQPPGMSGEEFFDQNGCADCHADHSAIAKATGGAP